MIDCLNRVRFRRIRTPSSEMMQ